MNQEDLCPKCGSPLTEILETSTGKQLRRCSTGHWNKETKQNEGCDYVKWLVPEPKTLEEKCPKCGAPLVLQITRFGKKMKKCSTSKWDSKTKSASGCDYVEWINGTSVPLDEDCPDCGSKLVLFTTASGKKMNKCSTAGWDKASRQATGCRYVYWFKFGEIPEMPDPDNQPPPPGEPE